MDIPQDPAEILDDDVGHIPDTLPLILVDDQVVFPKTVSPLHLRGQQEIQLLNDVTIGNRLLALATLRPAHGDTAGPEDAHEVGCVGRVLQLQHMPDGSVNVAIQALQRCRILGRTQREPYPIVRVRLIEDETGNPELLKPIVATVKHMMSRLIQLSPNIPDTAGAIVAGIEDPGFLADLIAANLGVAIKEKQKLLATLDQKQRLERIIYLLAREVEMLEVSEKIQNDVRNSIDESQREYFLRQQLKAIKQELGEGDDDQPAVREYREKIEEAGLSAEAQKEALREIDRLTKMNEASAEYHVITSFLDWLIELPWGKTTEDRLDLDAAEKILDQDHYGLHKVKRRILEYLAVRKLKKDAIGPILCFVGPPGVGKTSLGQSIARALERKFVRMSLGGMRDEAEIRGHRKTYVGALPGRIIQNIRKAQSSNPVFMLDEIDKVGSDFRGDPSSALLEVLDPAQNNSFTDLYLGVPFDLSSVMFIATANILDTIPWALRDRMEIIEIPGYTLEEKVHIARNYLVPRQLEAHGIPRGRLKFTAAALRKIIDAYTREAGVRNLEREIANVCRACAHKFATGTTKSISVTPLRLRTFLGNEKVHRDVAERTRIPGIATGLAWTATGGDILFVEATRMAGKGELVLTGQLGDVMKESAQTALSYIRANTQKLGIPDNDFRHRDIHIHVPAGAVPKDGPSAGIAILTALASLLLGKRVRSCLAMTGEITLRGLVLPVGGIKEKVLAAVRAGVKEIILPAKCANDLEDVPKSVRKKTAFHFVKKMDEVLRIALELKDDRPAKPKRKRKRRTKP